MKKKITVLVLVGSKSDVSVMRKTVEVLREFGVEAQLTVASAHRSPERTRELVEKAAAREVKLIIAAAGMAAHLAGVAAAHTELPVIGVPLASGMLGGLDALLSTVQMPPGVPVACLGVGEAGAANAAHLALRILALSEPELSHKIKAHKQKMARQVEEAAAEVEGEKS